MKFKVDQLYNGVDASYAMRFGITDQGAPQSVDNVFFCVTTAGHPYLVIYATDGSSYLDDGSDADIAEDTEYYLRLRSDVTNITCDVYSTPALFNAAAGGDVTALSITLADLGDDDFYCDLIGWWNSIHATYTGTEIWTVDWINDYSVGANFYQ